ncbi:iron ABC transporter permease (plasmid) [Bartonella sp. HY329]|uniref:FecCD family ABC transporter permease n=1 Tax=unclassified Bartonella TaxID=2645622 RepID=UPI0021C824F3|nr:MULTISPECIES: iron ABC transporter permease [unclassified Bartonella]UXM96657.1 iron ABC transporter permease [Bartonella sp. HY329]UXN10980.1 iron ABC transporter permease [Bartonella sp. HY328]
MTSSSILNSALFQWIGLPIILFLLVLSNLKIGAYPVSMTNFLEWISWRVLGTIKPDEAVILVIEKIRAPRILAAILIGAAFSCAGAAYQSIFRNPLVSPDILAVSSGAAFGACLAIIGSMSIVAIQMGAFLGGIGAVCIVLIIAHMVPRRDVTLVLVLAGIVVGSLFGAGVSLLKIIGDPYEKLPIITFWLLGSLSRVQLDNILIISPFFIIGIILLVSLRFRIDVMTIGEEEAKTLGIHTGRIRLITIICATLLTSIAVSIAGIIGWVGLVVPHISRMIVGPSFGRVGPTSAFVGAIFLLIVDSCARSLASTEIPLGILTAIIGAPIFIWLLIRGK